MNSRYLSGRRSLRWLVAAILLGGSSLAVADVAPAHPRPLLCPPAEKQRLLDRIRSSEAVRRQYEEIKARADSGNPGDAALAYALEGGQHHAAVVRKHLLETVRYRTPRLEEDIAAGGHREGNMDFYWDTAEVRWYDLVYSALSPEDRSAIETFYRKLGRYWRDSLNRWTTTPNLVFPIHYHGAVIGICMDDPELIEWGLHNPGGKFGPSRGGLFPTLDAMLRDGTIWDEATIYAAVNVLQPMMQLAILYRLYYREDLFERESSSGGSIRKLVDGYIALAYPLERTGVGHGSFHIATYGDGSTESPYIGHHRTDSIYLVNLPWARGIDRYELTGILEQAHYLSRDPKYAFFLSYAAERTPSFLYGEDIPFGSVKAPPAPSSVFPEAGIAMLRADESPDYWTNGSIAVLQQMGRGYGHDHRDKMMIVLHAAGRLFYPDMNCIQYEPASINWTRSSIAHNTLIVDGGQTANATSTSRHEFAPEMKFLATTASCYPGVNQTRVLVLTQQYLLDLFWAESDLPHTYDWALHSIGTLAWEQPALYRTSRDLVQDYWWVENEQSRRTGQTWRADFVQKTGLAIRGMCRHTDEWFDNGAAVRVTMVGEPDTTVYGGDGPTGGPPFDPIMNPEGNLPLLLVRRQARRTVFAAVHEPYRRESPGVAQVRRIAESRDAYAAEVRSESFIDRLAVAFGAQKETPVHSLRGSRDPQEVLVFSDHGYLRQTLPRPGETPGLLARGNWIGFRLRCPEAPANGPLLLNGKRARYEKEGEYVVFGDLEAAPESDRLLIAIEAALPEWAVPGQIVPAAWTLTNTGPRPISDVQLRLHVSAGCGGAGEPARAEQIPAGGRWTARFSLRMPQIQGDGGRTLDFTPEMSYVDEEGRHEALAPAEELLLKPALEITTPAEPIRLGTRDAREVSLKLRNWSPETRSARIELNLPPGVSAEMATPSAALRSEPVESPEHIWELPPVQSGQTLDLRLRLTTDDRTTRGLQPGSVRITGDSSHGWSAPVPLSLAIGPVLVEDNSYPTFGEYVIHAPRYTMRLSKRYGTSRFLRDDSDRPRYEATFWDRRPTAEVTPDALPRLRVSDRDALAWGDAADYLWPTAVPASVTVGTGRSRILWMFEDDAIRIEPVALWSEEAPHEFIFPDGRFGWTAWGGRPRWLHVVAADEGGEEQWLSAPPSGGLKILAAALGVPGYDEAICFAVDRPQTAHFEGGSVRLSVQPGESLWFGLARPEELGGWRQSRVGEGR